MAIFTPETDSDRAVARKRLRQRQFAISDPQRVLGGDIRRSRNRRDGDHHTIDQLWTLKPTSRSLRTTPAPMRCEAHLRSWTGHALWSSSSH